MDKFNDIWKNRFNESDIPVGDWNTPDPEVWDAIYPHVSKGNNRKGGIFWWLGMALILLTVASYFLFFKVDKNTDTGLTHNGYDSQLVHIVDNSLVASEQLPRITSSKTRIERYSNEDLITNEPKETVEPGITTSNNIAFDSSGKHIQENRSDTEREGVISRNDEDDFKIVLGNENTAKDEFADLYSSSDTKALFLPSLKLIPIESRKVDKLNAGKYFQADPILKSKKLKLNLESGGVYWQQIVSSSYTSDLAPFDFNYSNEIGWMTGVSAEYQLTKKLSIFSGIFYERVETNSGHNSELAYHLNNETEGATNNYDLSLATPYGISGASFRLDRNEALAEEETNLLVDFKSRHLVQNFSVPVGLKVFPIGQKQRFVPSATIGLGLNYLYKISNNIHDVDTHHDAIQYQKNGNVAFESPDLNNFHLDLRLGVGLDYYLTNDLQIGLNMNWMKGLNPVFEQDNYNTSINRYQMALGLKKSF